MGEEPVEADGNAVARDDVHREGDNDVVPAEPTAPSEGYGGKDREERDRDKDAERDLLGARLVVGAHRRVVWLRRFARVAVVWI